MAVTILTLLRCFGILVLVVEAKPETRIKAKQLGRHKDLGVYYGNLKSHPNSRLDGAKVGTVLVRKVGECGLACVGDHSCFSFNIAIQPDNSGHFTCELLATDKYNEPTKLTASGDFNHYSFATGCLNKPCKSGERCIPNYEHDIYKCV